MIDPWFLGLRGVLSVLSQHVFTEAAPSFPIIGVATNDGSIGALVTLELDGMQPRNFDRG